MGARHLVPRFARAWIKGKLQGRSLQLGQAGQDLWVIGEVFNEKRGGFFIDIGAHDGVELSNSYLLEKKYGWTGICIEANPESFAQLEQNRDAACVHACVDSQCGTIKFAKRGMHGGILGVGDEEGPCEVVRVEAKTLNQIIKEVKAPTMIDYLSVDVEGAEDRVFEGIDLDKLQVTCLTVERPSSQLRKKIEGAGFMIVREIPGLDAFYLRKDLADRYLQSIFAFYKKRHIAMRWK